MVSSSNQLVTGLSTSGLSSGAFNPPISTPDLNLRLGRVTKFDPYSLLCDLVLSGDNLELESVDRFANYSPTVGDLVWVLVSGPDLLVVDRAEGFAKKFTDIELATAMLDGNFGNNPKGPSMFASASGVSAAFASAVNSTDIYPAGTPIEGIALGSGAGGNQPQVITNVGPSGRVLMTLSVNIQIESGLDGATEGTGVAAVQISAQDGSYTITATPDYSGVVYAGPVGSSVSATRMAVFLVDSGPTVFAMRSAGIGATCRFSYRQLGILPL